MLTTRIDGTTPSFTTNGDTVRSKDDWGRTPVKARMAAKQAARNGNHSVIVWPTGNVTVYAVDDDGDLHRIRFVNRD